MSFNPSIPNISDFTAISQQQILANFQAINNTFFIDHVALTAVEDVGQHKSLTFKYQVGNPTTAANQSAIYTKLDGSSLPQLFFRPSSDQTPIQLTNSNLNTLQTGASGDTQSSFLAGPFTIYMGIVRNPPDGTVVTLLPSSTLEYVGLTTVISDDGTGRNPGVRSGSNAAAINIAANQFTISYNTAEFTVIINGVPTILKPIIYYMAIGQ